VRFVACDMPQANDLTVGIMALVAEAERDLISKRTKEALAAPAPMPAWSSDCMRSDRIFR
jgi:DNA invertase Pin-like site-specific DNA recombinase